jgi:hypothetical protein
MTIAPHASAVHSMVDQLAPGQVEALYVILQGMLPEPPISDISLTAAHEEELADQPVRELSFIGLFAGEPDLAERSKEIVREEIAKRAHADH